MPTFPSIQLPDAGGFKEIPIDTTIRSGASAGGYVQTRAGHTRDLFQFYLPWEALPLTDADYITLKAFISTVRFGAVEFTWTHSFTHTEYTVRFREVPEFRLNSDGGVPGWSGHVLLEEV